MRAVGGATLKVGRLYSATFARRSESFSDCAICGGIGSPQLTQSEASEVRYIPVLWMKGTVRHAQEGLACPLCMYRELLYVHSESEREDSVSLCKENLN